MDIPLVSENFTWSNNQNPPWWFKIDRHLLSPNLKAQFPDVSQERLPRILSNHFPLLQDYGDVARSKRYFKLIRGPCEKKGETMVVVLQLSRLP